MWVLLPLKDFVKAKQRLSTCLSVTERRCLFQAMVEDVLDVLVTVGEIDRIILLSDDPTAHLLARNYQLECWSERELGQGLNPVLEGAVSRIQREHPAVERVMIVHGDLPLINRAELRAMIIAQHRAAVPAMAIATDACGEGSNVMIMPLKHRVALQYGPLSLQAHQGLAAQLGLACIVQRSNFLAKDIDTQEDILDLIASAEPHSARRTMGYLQQQGLLNRLAVIGNIQGISTTALDTQQAAIPKQPVMEQMT